jgi:hypothetical protein
VDQSALQLEMNKESWMRPFSIGNWCKFVLIVFGLGLGSACRATPPAKPLPPGIIPLKIATLTFGEVVMAYLISPLDGSAFQPPKRPRHSTQVVAFDPRQPLPRTFRVIWTSYQGAFGSYTSSGSGVFSKQMPLSSWGHDDTVTLEGPIPANPAHLLLIFGPKGRLQAEILSEAQMEAGTACPDIPGHLARPLPDP